MENRNQIWEPYLALLQRGEDTSKLHYIVKNNRVSPYLELQTDNLYEDELHSGSFSHLDVNPYVRFFKIFDPLLTPDDLGYEEFNQALADVIIHYLADMDVRLGMCKQDFYAMFLVRDMEQGAFGGTESLVEFTEVEKRQIAEWLLCFYRTGNDVESLSGVVRVLLPLCEIFIREGEEFVFYMREPWNASSERRLAFLLRLFFPLSYSWTVHWMETYGVIGYEETMHLSSFVLA